MNLGCNPTHGSHHKGDKPYKVVKTHSPFAEDAQSLAVWTQTNLSF